MITQTATINLKSFPVRVSADSPHEVLYDWVSTNKTLIEIQLAKHGALILRGFSPIDAKEFVDTAKLICPSLSTDYRDLRHEENQSEVYSPTRYPVEHAIQFHNESAHNHQWPLYLFFSCRKKAFLGGRSLFADSRRVLRHMSPSLRQAMEQYSVTYKRTYYPHVDVDWKIIFNTQDPRIAEKRCRKDGTRYRWLSRDTLQTRCTRPLVQQHPVSNEQILFHQLFLFHQARLDEATRSSLEALYQEQPFPRSVSYENGMPIADEHVQELYDLYDQYGVYVELEENDFVVVDNMVISHGREAYQGPRKMWVAMGGMMKQQATASIQKDSQKREIQLPDPTRVLETKAYPSVISLIETQLKLNPKAIAIEEMGHSYTYEELWETAGSIAQQIINQELPEGTVGIHLPRGHRSITSILGVWMSGRVILLIDPDLPAARKYKMLRKAGAVFLLQEEERSFESALPAYRIDDTYSSPLTPRAEADYGDAYIFFTSGTTGEPRGVTGTHQGLAHFLNWQSNTFSIAAGHRFGHFTHLSFDVVLRDIFAPLVSGATLCIPPDSLNMSKPWEWFRGNGITHIHTVPSLAQVWLSTRTKDPLPDLSVTFFAGEPLSDRLVKTWGQVAPNSEVINLYGPTETTLAKSWHRIPPTPEKGIQAIGNALPGTQLLILNEDLKQCCPHETGEIFIRTPYRTKGYIDCLNDRSFLQNPYTNESEDLIYATGDLGRYREDGLIDILGRADNQIKRFGVRIDLSEIVYAALEHPSVHQAYVTTSGDQEKELVLHCATEDKQLTERLVFEFLKEQLPISHLPQSVRLMGELPLTASGKIDRNALILFSTVVSDTSSSSYVAPSGNIEERLAKIWGELLGKERIGRDDDFFTLGGHSIMAMQLVANAATTWNVDLSVADIFESSTLKDFADKVINAQPATRKFFTPGEIPALKEHVPLSSSQNRIWLAVRLSEESSVYHIPGAIRISGPLDVSRLKNVLQEIVNVHEQFRTAISTEDHIPYQKVIPDVSMDIPTNCLEPGEDETTALRQLGMSDFKKPFDLAKPPLARFRIVRLSDENHVLLYVFHHLIADGWSNALFVQQVLNGYELQKTIKSRTSYLEFATWEQSILNEQSNHSRTYWREQLTNAPSLSLSTDVIDTSLPSKGFCKKNVSLEVKNKLLNLCEQYQLTPFMVMLGSFHLTLMQVTGQKDVTVGTPVTNRNHPSLESVIGCFINTLAIRCAYPEETSFASFLQQVKEKVLGAFTYQDTPFDHVVRWVAPERIDGQNPLFQVLFNYLPFEELTQSNESIEWKRDWVISPEAKFDVTLYVREQADRFETHLVYDTKRFSERRMEDFLDNFHSMLDLCVEDVSSKLPALKPGLPLPTPKPANRGKIRGSISTIDQVLSVWQSALSRSDLTEDSHFFEVGGYSLLAANIIDSLSSTLNKPLPLQCIFEYPVIKTLAAFIDSFEAKEEVALAPGSHNSPSYIQKQIWNFHKAGKDVHYFNVPRAIRIQGEIDVTLFSSILADVVNRHPMLRTVYRDEEGDLKMIRLENGRPSFEFIDISDKPDEEEARIIDQLARHRFDLSNDVLLKVALLRRSTNNHTLVVTTHHIAADCWSMGLPFQALPHPDAAWHHGVFVDDLFALYDARISRRAYPDPAYIQFPDIVNWVEAKKMNEEQAYWRETLADAPHAFQLPFDFPRPETYTFEGCRRAFELPHELYDSVKQFSEAQRTTIFSVLLSAFNLTLFEWTKTHDFLVGTPIASRIRPEMKNVIGHISNTLVFRAQINEQGSIESQIQQTSNGVRKAFENQIYPFHRVLEDLEVDASVEYPPLFQVRFVFQQAQPSEKTQNHSFGIQPVSFDRKVSKYDLSLVVAEHGGHWRGWCEYNTNLFQKSTIEKFSARYVAVLLHIVDHPTQCIAQFLKSQERES